MDVTRLRAFDVVDDLARECLDGNWFVTMDDARSRIEAWTVDHDRVRPHHGLDNFTPSEFARSLTGLASSAVQ